jgi:hypothetical protein
LGTQLVHSSSYHPQSDGQTKIVNKSMEGYLCCFVSDKQTQWFKSLTLVELWYNTSFHTAKKNDTIYGALWIPPSFHHFFSKIKIQGSRSGRSHRTSTTSSPNLKGQPNHGT